MEEIDAAIAARPTNAINYIRRARELGTGRSEEKRRSLELDSFDSFSRALELDPSLYASIEDEYCALRESLSEDMCIFTSRVPGDAAVYDAVLWPGHGSNNVERVICATADGNIYVFGLTCGGPPQVVLEGHEDIVTTLALSPDGRRLLSGSLDKTVRAWDLSAIENAEVVENADNICDSTQVTDNDRGASVRIAPTATLEGHSSRINRLRWMPCGTRAISSSTDATLRLWDISHGVCISEMTGHGALVSSIDLSKEGTVCASASGDAVCKLWAINHGDDTSGVDNRYINDKTKLMEDIAWESGPVVLCRFVEYASHGEYLLTAHAQLVQQQARILLWDIFDKETGWVDGRLRAPRYAIDDLRGCPTSMDTARVQGGEFAGTELLACACSDGKVHVWDIDECPVKLETFSLEEPGRAIPDDLPAWSVTHLRHASNKLNMVAFSPSGAYLAATRSESNSVIVWDVDEGERVCQFYGHRSPIRKVLWISLYKLISVSEDGSVRGWSLDPDRLS